MTAVKLENISREDLEMYIYDAHKTAFGVKGRHYDFAAMTIEQLRKEAEYIADECDKTIARERASEANALIEFRATIRKIREMCNCDRDTAIRYMLEAEGHQGEYDPSYICYCMNLPYSMAKYIEPRLKMLNEMQVMEAA